MANYGHTTLQGHLEANTPRPDYSMPDSPWFWEYWKAGFESPDVLFTTLQAMFNAINMPILNKKAWMVEFRNAHRIAKNMEELRALLKKRQEETFNEIQEIWHAIRIILSTQPQRWNMPHNKRFLSKAFMCLVGNLSYEGLVRFFSIYAFDNRSPIPIFQSASTIKRFERYQRLNSKLKESASPGVARKTRLKKHLRLKRKVKRKMTATSGMIGETYLKKHLRLKIKAKGKMTGTSGVTGGIRLSKDQQGGYVRDTSRDPGLAHSLQIETSTSEITKRFAKKFPVAGTHRTKQ
ncbi:hypothetical protein N7475_010541 [Penicillium sp. IBT 31633x]|nr:hypothetical protein N7475_010541 [Penicillium sp. IBT 31633x]